jgi:hypothetical protein
LFQFTAKMVLFSPSAVGLILPYIALPLVVPDYPARVQG